MSWIQSWTTKPSRKEKLDHWRSAECSIHFVKGGMWQFQLASIHSIQYAPFYPDNFHQWVRVALEENIRYLQWNDSHTEYGSTKWSLNQLMLSRVMTNVITLKNYELESSWWCQRTWVHPNSLRILNDEQLSTISPKASSVKPRQKERSRTSKEHLRAIACAVRLPTW
jgi:hypothetical protein